MNFKNVPKKYRPVPFWSWNEKLNIEETKRQIDIMDNVGIGGFFMHARGGLQTEYMKDEWFENISVSVKEGNKRKMSAWAYDENGWPSGFGNGIVNGLGVEYQQKYLRFSETVPKNNLIEKCGSRWFYYDVNPFYVDVLDKKVISKFIEVAYKPYYDRYGNNFEGFFTDEPQISRNGIPWSFVFETEYKERYSENIIEHLEELFFCVGDYKQTRIKFWKMVTDLFSSAFFKQIYDQCEKWGVKLTGHLVLEEDLSSQLTTNGACMPHYEYFSIPGMDWLGRNINKDCFTPKQVSSVAEQLGKQQVLSETYALCGHNVSFDELKGIYEWQMVHGINLLCQHLEGYSLRGIRKRDYPPAMYYQQPWWNVYDKFVDAMSREGMILSQGKKRVDVLLIHPQTTAWTLFDNGKNHGLDELNEKFKNAVAELEKKHIVFHFGDETVMERHGRVENNKLVIGNQSYSYVLNPCGEYLLPNTEKLLAKFKHNGGKLNVEPLQNDVTDNGDITYTCCEYDDFNVHYFVNTSPEVKKAEIKVSGKKLNIYIGELENYSKIHEFEPWGSLIIIDDGTENTAKEEREDIVFLPNDAKIIGSSGNVLTLDKCDYWFDGELQERMGYVLNIAERANKLERKVRVRQEYHVKADFVPKEIYLVCETPEIFNIDVNGNTVKYNTREYFRDIAFKKIDISGLLSMGDNIITFECDFKQSDEFYTNLKNSFVFEGEKNKLVYDTEIEPIYLFGDFSVKTAGNWQKLDKSALRYTGDFVLSAPVSNICIKNIEKQGFAFFSGELTLKSQIDIKGENPVLVVNRKGINAVKIEINGIEKTLITGNKISLKEFDVNGKTEVKVTAINNLRNMMGPHHLKEGESYNVTPSSFFKEQCIWNLNPDDDWDGDYCFTEMSL